MTTVAWDGRTLAADTQSSLYRLPVRKIYRLNEHKHFYGACGDVQICRAVHAWLMGEDKPALSDADKFHGLLIEDGKVFTLESRLIKIPHDSPFIAIGSGRDFAMGAMACGKSAADAVRIAMQFDVDTGGDVDEISY